MAQPLPPPLKIPEVYRFVNRANQLRTVKPAIAYWCEYHAVNQIVAKGLHTADNDAYAFTTALLERLETTKTEYANDDSIVDNDAAQAFVEMFAQEVFQRAEKTMRANKVTRQTADTFDAAATFFDLLREWGELDLGILKKIKFAKWNAARILKDIREGKDPNESNPPDVAQEEEAGLDEDELAQLEASDAPVQGTVPQSATVQEVPDDGEPVPGPSHSAQPSAPPPDDYFPPIPSSLPSDDPPPSVPEATPSIPPAAPPPSTQIPPQPSPQIPTKLPSQYAPPSPPPPSSAPSVPSTWTTAPSEPSLPPTIPQPQPTPSPAPPVVPTPAAVAAPPPISAAPPPVAAHYKDINQAQKHAKFAISALNFEDIPTAVNELRKALAALGTQ